MTMPDSSFYARMGRLSSIIFVLPSAMAVGWILGYFLIDRYLRIFPWGTIIMTMAGAGAGLYEIIKILNLDRENKDDQS
jgi:F0F1-type ATP synthase assembly protein I